MTPYAVAEDSSYNAGPGGNGQKPNVSAKTVYIEEDGEKKTYRLFDTAGKVLCTINKTPVMIGKKSGETDCTLENDGVSRLHARITKEKEFFYLEDMNSTNGTFKNGEQLQPYEKCRLQEGDEIRLGKTVIIFR